MARMKTFLIYFLIFLAIYFGGQLLINGFIKTSYYKIETYDISEDQLTVTVMSARASKDDGFIEGKISNGTNEKSPNKYMKVELFSEGNVNLGEEYVQIGEMNSKDIKDFKVSFTCDNVKSFKVSFITPEQKKAIDEEKNKPLVPEIKINQNVVDFVDSIDPVK